MEQAAFTFLLLSCLRLLKQSPQVANFRTSELTDGLPYLSVCMVQLLSQPPPTVLTLLG